MTAQMSVMNRKCIALATDSAVTRTKGNHCKAFNTADKLFQLGKHIPVGIMIYNNAEFLGISWELIIKQYRVYLGKKKYNTLAQYCEDFFKFVKEIPEINDKLKLDYALQIIDRHLENLFHQIQFNLNKINNNEEIIKNIVFNTFLNYLSLENKNIYEEDYQWLSQYDEDIQQRLFQFININQLQFENNEINKMIEILKMAALSEKYTDNYAGIVFAGYGELEWFPRLYNYEIEGFINNHLKYRAITEEKIGINQDKNERRASITPFAQSEMALSFITGVHPLLSDCLRNIIEQLCFSLNSTIKDIMKHEKINVEIDERIEQAIDILGQNLPINILSNFNKIQSQKYITPLLEMVDDLDKSQMAELAETLVNLTLFKRKMSMDTDTVGGPIDVAIISKGEGFIWIKRKHYFKLDLNPDYTNN